MTIQDFIDFADECRVQQAAVEANAALARRCHYETCALLLSAGGVLPYRE